jgi:hypothetical protein
MNESNTRDCKDKHECVTNVEHDIVLDELPLTLVTPTYTVHHDIIIQIEEEESPSNNGSS